MQCVTCHDNLEFDEKCTVVISYPSPDGDIFCPQCWFDLLACADAWLARGVDVDGATQKSRVEEARALWRQRNDLLAQKDGKGRKNAS